MAEIAARFEKDTGRRVTFTWGGSEAIAKRVAEGEVFDAVVNTAPGVDRMAAEGKLVNSSRTDFSRSAVAVRAGLPRPDVSSVDALKASLLQRQAQLIGGSPRCTQFELLARMRAVGHDGHAHQARHDCCRGCGRGGAGLAPWSAQRRSARILFGAHRALQERYAPEHT